MTGSRMRRPVYVRLSPAEYQTDTGWIVAELDRLELLVPEVAAGSKRDPLTYALAYVEHYRGDVLALEHEQEFLAAAVLQAWQRTEYGMVTRLVAGLAPILSRLDDSTEAVRLLRLGIDASQRTQDLPQLARFLNCLGGVLNAQGRYLQGHEFWFSGLELGKSYGATAGVWEPLLSFVMIADMLGGYDDAKHYVTAMLDSSEDDDTDGLAVALFIRGLYARGLYDLDKAYDDFSQALRLLSASTTPPTPNRQLATLAVQTEWSRLQDSYARSQAYAESALALAQIFSDRYTVATLLIDQAVFTRQYGTPDDTRATYLRLREVAHQTQARHIHNFGQTLERYLNTTALRNAIPPASPASLSEREVELLRLVAAGLSNWQIGEQLVITPGTVKKHLEHVYTKLDVHNRTAAVTKARALHLVS